MSNKFLNAIIIYTILYIILINNKKIKKSTYIDFINSPINKYEDCLTLPFINILIAIISFILSYYILK